MQSTFSVPNGSVPGWIPALQLQPVMQPTPTFHSAQIQPTVQPNQTHVMVVRPSNQIQQQLYISHTGLTNPRSNTDRMKMASQAWKSDNKVQNDANRCRWQQEKVILQQQYQLLHAEYQTALVHIQTLTLQHQELDKKLKINHCKYQDLNNTYVITMQREQNKYNALTNMYNETCIQLRDEKGRCNALTIKLEESAKKLRNEQQRYGDLSRMHAETKKLLHSARQKRDGVVKFIESKNKSSGDKDNYETVSLNLSGERHVKPSLRETYFEHVSVSGDKSQSGTYNTGKAAEANKLCEGIKHLVVPPGFERSTRVSGKSAHEVE